MSNLISLVIIVASIGMFFGYIDPTYSKIQASRTDLAEYDRALNNSKDLQSERDKLLKKFNEIPKADRDALEKLLPDNIDNVRLIIDIDEMAKQYGMRIRDFSAQTIEKKETIGKDNSAYGSLGVSFTTSASYNTFLAFIRDLEKSLRIMDITAIQFGASDTQVYDYSVDIRTYWLK